MKIVITGAGGQLGLALARALSGEHELIAVDRAALDISTRSACFDLIDAVKPHVVLNCAAHTAVDRAESERALAFAINRDGAENLALACERSGSFLVHFSTDYVFDGVAPRTHVGGVEQPRAYVETDATAPLGVYGESKLAGERAVAAATSRHAIFRLSWVYSNDGANFYKTMLRLAAERDQLRVVSDQIGIPNFTGDLAASVASLLSARGDALFRHPGLYHLSARGAPVSWHAFASAIIAAAPLSKRPRIEPITTADYPTPAKRPAWSALDGSRFAATFATNLPNWEDGLARCLRERALSA